MSKVSTILPGGRASIVTWEFDVTFLLKGQATGFVRALLKEDIDFPVSFEVELDATHTLYVVHVGPMSWANNVVTLAKILRKFDHKA